MSAATRRTQAQEDVAAAAATSTGTFFGSLPTLSGFHDVANLEAYAPLPADWVVGIADVVRSTEAIRAGRYKAVNTAGAAVISAISNALHTLDFPYVFAGDGMCYAVHRDQAERTRNALAACIAWVETELSLTLRGGDIDVGEIRAAGLDVRVARYAASPDASYAMFAGGGVVWAEAELKAGRLQAIRPDPDSRPDLSGLSCRFRPIDARHGLVLSLIVQSRGGPSDAGFRRVVTDLLDFIEASPDASLPIQVDSLPLPWPPRGFLDEARLQRRRGEPLAGSLVRTGAWTLFSALVMAAGRNLGSFSPARYRRQLVANADHRKFEDRLMMTLDCSSRVADAIASLLEDARRDGIVDFGSHRQATALITCVVPSPTRPDHVHFVDGAAGGYALAALELKRTAGSLPGSPSSSGPAAPAVTSSARLS